MAHVVVESKKGASKFIVDKTATVGRSSQNEIPIKDSAISRVHALIYRDGTVHYLKDLHSKNGTLLNGKKSVQPELLKDGDKIELGDSVLTFYAADLSSAPADAAPASAAPAAEAPKVPFLVRGTKRKAVTPLTVEARFWIWAFSLAFFVAVIVGSHFIFSKILDWSQKS